MCKYEIHPAADCFPMMNRIQLEALKGDIISYGQKSPALVYKGYLIDGRNRDIVCGEIGEELIVTHVDDDLVGPDVIAFVRSVNEHRRHLTPSQLADVAVAIEELYAKMHKKATLGRGTSATLPTPGVNGRSRALAAAENGCGERLVQKAKKVRKNGHESVSKAVKNGHVAVGVAEELVSAVPDHNRQKAIIDEALAAPNLTAAGKFIRDAIAVRPEPVLDEAGQEIPSHLQAAFAAAATFDQRMKELAAMQKWAEGLKDIQAGAWLHVDSFKAHLKNAREALKFSRPYAVCPYCQAADPKCDGCKGHGFVDKLRYQSAPSELRL